MNFRRFWHWLCEMWTRSRDDHVSETWMREHPSDERWRNVTRPKDEP
jgi:hypothetical protein